ncbi:MAG: hypothetical protein JWM32_1481 [Verrucomicrobia bacterium]|nr:hypothetical protein [Verrucomicrobiota bacterium]
MKSESKASTENLSSRRTFLGQTGVLAGAALLPATLRGEKKDEAAPPKPTATEPTATAPYLTSVVTLKPTGWNLNARRFVDAPTWAWEPFPGAAGYVVMVAAANDRKARTIKLTEPRYDMGGDWAQLPYGRIDLLAWAVDRDGKALCAAWPNASGGRRFYKSQDFDGKKQAPLDWKKSVERAMAYLLAPARDQVHAFEGDMPRLAWSSSEESITGQRRLFAFPCLHYPAYIRAYHAFAAEFPHHPLAPEAIRQAGQYADWLLEHRQPATWRCGLMPYSTISSGEFHGLNEGRNIMLFRSARVGDAMILMYRQTGKRKYLDYAHHIAGVLIDMQNPDGSWPLRIDPETGAIVENYTSAAIVPAKFLGALEQLEPNPKYAAARLKAVQWVLANPVRDNRWESPYEDVVNSPPFMNLQNWDINETICYLAHYHRNDPAMLPVAEKIHRFIEDQFVIWNSDDQAIVEQQVPAPVVLEQYACYRPMECHTATWVRTLIAMHRYTGNEVYLQKAINGANAILGGQQETGAYSTWGFDQRFGRPSLTLDWPGCNAMAVDGLITLDRYLRALPRSQAEEQPL